MTDDHCTAALSVGDRDPELAEVLDKGLNVGRALGIPGGGEDVHMFKRFIAGVGLPRAGIGHAGMRATLYSLKRLSRVTIVSPSASAWAMSMRSNGSS